MAGSWNKRECFQSQESLVQIVSSSESGHSRLLSALRDQQRHRNTPQLSKCQEEKPLNKASLCQEADADYLLRVQDSEQPSQTASQTKTICLCQAQQVHTFRFSED